MIDINSLFNNTHEILEILNKFGINGIRNKSGTDKASLHCYDLLYEHLFKKYKDININVLEIGVMHGASSLLWNKYLKKSKVIMVDIVNEVPQYIWDNMEKERYDYHLMDAYNIDNLNILKNKYNTFDIIIEDGAHSLETQLFTVENYLSLLNTGGCFIIEDIQSSNDASVLLNSVKNKEKYKNVELVDLRNVKRRYDDLVLLIEK